MMAIIEFFNSLTFNQAIWMLPIIFIVHFLEELPRFPTWAKEYINQAYTTKKFIIENMVMFVLILIAVLVAIFLPNVGIIFVLAIAIAFFTNMIFHTFFTLKTGIYSPGIVTACIFFVPMPFYLYYLAEKEGLLTSVNVIISLIIGLILFPILLAIGKNYN